MKKALAALAVTVVGYAAGLAIYLRDVDLHRGLLPEGGQYALLHRPALLRSGCLVLRIRTPDSEADFRLMCGYDLYVDLRLRAAISDRVLFIAEERFNEMWAVSLDQLVFVDQDPPAGGFHSVGEAHQR